MPAGTNNAITLTATASSGFNAQNYYYSAGNTPTITSGAPYSISMFMRRRTGSGAESLASPNYGQNNVTLTSSWQRFVVSANASSTDGWVQVDVLTSGDAIDIAFGQLEAGSFATSYIPHNRILAVRSPCAIRRGDAQYLAR